MGCMKFPSIKINYKQPDFRQFIKYGVFVVLAGMLGNLVFSFFTTDRSIIGALSQFRPLYFILAILLSLFPWLTNTLRLMIWTRFLGKRYSFRELFKIILSQDIGSAVSPTAVGGGYVKAGMLIKRGLSTGAATSLMTLSTFEDGVFFMFALPIAVILSSCWKLPVIRDIVHHLNFAYNYLVLAGVVILLIATLVILLKYTRIAERSKLLTKLLKTSKKVWKDFVLVYMLIGKRGKTRFAVTITLTAIQWICRYSVVTALLASLRIPVDPVLFFLFQWVTFTIMTMIPTPGAAAGAEASFYFIYTPFIPKEFLGLMTMGWRFLTFYLQVSLSIIIIAAIYFSGIYKKNPESVS